MLPVRVRVELGAIAMKEYSAFPKVPGLEPHHRIFSFISRTLVWGVLLICRDAIGVFYSSSRLSLYLSLLLTRQDLIQGQWLEGRLFQPNEQSINWKLSWVWNQHKVKIIIYIYILIIFSDFSNTNRIRYKVNFWAGYSWFEFRVNLLLSFSFSMPHCG